jgi:deoxyribonuclease-4
MNIGAHVRGGGKLIPSLEEGVDIGATSIQIFTQSPRMWKPSQYAPEVLEAYREAQANHPSVTHTFCHATYLINLATPDEELYEKSVACLISNLSTGRGMASSGVVLHVGSHKGNGFEAAVPQIAEAFKRALDAADSAPPGVADCPILIENAAGADGPVGHSFDEIQALIDATGGDERIGMCIDTQHLWASGVDYSSTHSTNKLVHEIDMRIGLGRLRCFHLNDSKIELGGNRDRHANIDEGTIGTAGLAALVGHPDFRGLPLLLEVPGTGEGPRWEDVMAARKVVIEGIKLYDGEVSADLEAMVLVMPPAATRPPEKKKPAKKATAKKAPAAKTAATKSPAKAPAKKAPAKKSPAKKSPAKKSPAKKSPAKKSPAKKSPAKKSPVKESSAKKSPAKKSPAKKAPAKKSLAKKSPAKKSAAKKTPVKKSPTKKAPAKEAKKLAKKK